MARRSSYLRTAADLMAAIGPEECALAGGLAVWAHGFVRGTRDVDLIVGVALPEAKRRLAARGIKATLKRGDPWEGDIPCLKGEMHGVPFDVLPQLVAVPWDLAIPLRLSGRVLRVVDLATLLALKLKAAGPKDLMDVAMLVLLHPDYEARARQWAGAYKAMARLEPWLKDRRLRTEARAIKTRERALARMRKARRTRANR